MSRFPSLPQSTNLSDVFKSYPAGIPELLEFHDIVLRKPSPLSVAQRELIAALVSGLNACHFCFGAHSVIAESYGIKPAVLEELVKDIDSAKIDDDLKVLLRYVKKLTLSPSKITDSDAQSVFAAGWSERALHDTVMVCALFNFMNRLVEGHGVITSDSIRAGQEQRSEQSDLNSESTYRDYGRKIGVYSSKSPEDILL